MKTIETMACGIGTMLESAINHHIQTMRGKLPVFFFMHPNQRDALMDEMCMLRTSEALECTKNGPEAMSFDGIPILIDYNCELPYMRRSDGFDEFI